MRPAEVPARIMVRGRFGDQRVTPSVRGLGGDAALAAGKEKK